MALCFPYVGGEEEGGAGPRGTLRSMCNGITFVLFEGFDEEDVTINGHCVGLFSV